MELTRGNSTRRALLWIGLVGVLAAALFMAACGGDSAAATSTPEEGGSTVQATGGEGTTPVVSGPGNAPVVSGSGNAPLVSASGQGTAPVVSGSGTLPQSRPAGESAAGLAFPSVQFAPNQQVGIWVNGMGQVTVDPDLAILSVGVEARAKTVAEARDQAARGMEQIMQVLDSRKVESNDIKTQFFNISPEYQFNDRIRRQELVGYRVSNQVTVKIRDIESTGPILDDLVEAGGDLVRVQGISFTREDTKALESQARKLAVEDLMNKAQEYAKLTGVELGKPIFLSEGGGATALVARGAPETLAMSADAKVATSISPGELRVTITVQGVFAMN